MKFDLEKAQEKAGNLYRMQQPHPDCAVCNGAGIKTVNMQVGMEDYPVQSYCECTVEGFMQKEETRAD